MSRAHALELVLGPEDDAWVRARWAALEDAGIASLARHRGATHRPHLTVASSPRPPEQRVLALASEQWGPLLPLQLDVTGLVLLGGRRLTIADLVSAPLSARRAQAELTWQWEGADERPWVPHVSLATRLTTESAGMALAALSVASREREDGPGGRGDGVPGRGAGSGISGRGAGSGAGRSLTVEALRWWDPEAESVSDVAVSAA